MEIVTLYGAEFVQQTLNIALTACKYHFDTSAPVAFFVGQKHRHHPRRRRAKRYAQQLTLE
jgi:hypothetical protein